PVDAQRAQARDRVLERGEPPSGPQRRQDDEPYDPDRTQVLTSALQARAAGRRRIAPSFARVAQNSERLIVVNSFSKTYNMTGWRLGWAQGSEQMIHLMYKAAEFITSNPPAMVQQAGIAALRDGETYVDDLREEYAQRRAEIVSTLSDLPGISL